MGVWWKLARTFWARTGFGAKPVSHRMLASCHKFPDFNEPGVT